MCEREQPKIVDEIIGQMRDEMKWAMVYCGELCFFF